MIDDALVGTTDRTSNETAAAAGEPGAIAETPLDGAPNGPLDGNALVEAEPGDALAQAAMTSMDGAPLAQQADPAEQEDPLEALAVQYVAQADAAAAATDAQAETPAPARGDEPAGDEPATSSDAGTDVLNAMAALVTDEGASEVADPDPATLVNTMPPLKDIPDDVPRAPVSAKAPATPVRSDEASAAEGTDPTRQASTAVWSASDVEAAMRAEKPAAGTDGDGSGPDAQGKAREAAVTRAGGSDGLPGDPDIDHIEATAFAHESTSPSQTLPFSAVEAELPVQPRATERMSGAAKGTGSLAWGSRSDVGCVRDHNEDSYLVQFPLFAIADGMGGHEAGEIASTLAVSSLAAANLNVLDSVALGHAIEAANAAVIQAADNGLGRPGMGTTCTAVYIEGNQMAVGHVGDSRCYLLHAGQLVRVTHDHSYVEELVAAGKITPEEARIHPNRSVITRALGSDPAMYADAFTIDLSRGDRILLCSDGLNSMVTDDLIEEAMVTTPTPQNCADALVELALDAGGYDNVTCVVVDVKDDGTQANALRARMRNVGIAIAVALATLLVVGIAMYRYASHSWYLDDANGYVTLHRGIPGDWGFLPFNEEVETTDVMTSKLADLVETRLHSGISFDSEQEARDVIEDYRAQIEAAEAAKAQAAEKIDDARKAAGSEGPDEPSGDASQQTDASPEAEEGAA